MLNLHYTNKLTMHLYIDKFFQNKNNKLSEGNGGNFIKSLITK